MGEIKVSDYTIFSDAGTSVKKLLNEIDNLDTSLGDCKRSLDRESVFFGPICESSIEGLNQCHSRVTTMSDNYKIILKYVNQLTSAYKNGDEAAANKILKLKDGKISIAKSSASTGKKSGNANRDYIHDYLANQGFNEAAICGILANIKKETNFRSDIGGDYGTSYGMCGWHATRWDRLKNYCQSHNLDIRTVQTQSQFLVWELKNCYPDLYKALKSVPNTAQGAYDAAHLFTIKFERPQGMYEKADQRGNIAAGEYYPFYMQN